MKLLLVIFFVLGFPIFLFLTTILYSSDITPILKSDLVKHHIYDQLSSQLDNLDSGDSNSQEINTFIQSKFTKEYIQQKVETALDSSTNWINGKSTTPPVISFKDVKDDLNAQYPQLLPSIENAAQEMKNQQAQESTTDASNQQKEQAIKGTDMLAKLAKSDFTIKLNTYLVGLKDFYSTVRILQPILGLLLLGSLFLLGLLNKTWSERFKWIGITFMISGIAGFILAFGNIIIIQLLSSLAANNTNHIVQMTSPIVLQLINHYVDAYVTYQKIAGLVLLVTAGGCFLGVAFTRNSPVTSVKTPVASPKPKVSKKK